MTEAAQPASRIGGEVLPQKIHCSEFRPLTHMAQLVTKKVLTLGCPLPNQYPAAQRYGVRSLRNWPSNEQRIALPPIHSHVAGADPDVPS